MKLFIFRYPVRFSILFGIIALILSINSIHRGNPWSLLSTLVLAVIYLNMAKFGENLDRQRRLMVLLCGFLVISFIAGYAFYRNGSLW